jgi:hypothetical protein
VGFPTKLKCLGVSKNSKNHDFDLYRSENGFLRHFQCIVVKLQNYPLKSMSIGFDKKNSHALLPRSGEGV